MEKETIIARTLAPKASPRIETPIRTMPIEKARKPIRKTPDEHAELFRRLSK